MNTTKRNWKTTIAGILTLACAGWGIYQDPTAAANPQMLSTILAGVGLIVAKDATGEDPSKTVPVPATKAN